MEIERSKTKKITDFLRLLLLSLAVAVFIRYFVFIPVKVEGSSMSPTLEHNTHIVYEPFTTLERFDIILFHDSQGEAFIKRIVGLPGERLRYEDDQLYINDEPIDEPILDLENEENQVDTADFTLESLTGLDVIPEENYYVLGDNRSRSKDSRMFGFVPKVSIEGKARLVIYPFDKIAILP